MFLPLRLRRRAVHVGFGTQPRTVRAVFRRRLGELASPSPSVREDSSASPIILKLRLSPNATLFLNLFNSSPLLANPKPWLRKVISPSWACVRGPRPPFRTARQLQLHRINVKRTFHHNSIGRAFIGRVLMDGMELQALRRC